MEWLISGYGGIATVSDHPLTDFFTETDSGGDRIHIICNKDGMMVWLDPLGVSDETLAAAFYIVADYAEHRILILSNRLDDFDIKITSSVGEACAAMEAVVQDARSCTQRGVNPPHYDRDVQSLTSSS